MIQSMTSLVNWLRKESLKLFRLTKMNMTQALIGRKKNLLLKKSSILRMTKMDLLPKLLLITKGNLISTCIYMVLVITTRRMKKFHR